MKQNEDTDKVFYTIFEQKRICYLFSDLRKQARQLENEIDLKLVSFSKLGTSYSHSDYGR